MLELLNEPMFATLLPMDIGVEGVRGVYAQGSAGAPVLSMELPAPWSGLPRLRTSAGWPASSWFAGLVRAQGAGSGEYLRWLDCQQRRIGSAAEELSDAQ